MTILVPFIFAFDLQEHPPGLCLPDGREMGPQGLHGGGAGGEDPGHCGAGQDWQGGRQTHAVLWHEGQSSRGCGIKVRVRGSVV